MGSLAMVRREGRMEGGREGGRGGRDDDGRTRSKGREKGVVVDMRKR